jgi:hypothetical protein
MSRKWDKCNPLDKNARSTTRPLAFKPSLRDVNVPEDPHVIGPRGGSESCDSLDLPDQISPNLIVIVCGL